MSDKTIRIDSADSDRIEKLNEALSPQFGILQSLEILKRDFYSEELDPRVRDLAIMLLASMTLENSCRESISVTFGPLCRNAELMIRMRFPEGRIEHDVIDDAEKKYTIEDFFEIRLDQLIEFVQLEKESRANPANDEQRITEHTVNEWSNYFRRWVSW